ncbi:TniQ family protein [Rhizobium sp. PP-CC-3G-465]|uniref:TniQ family protein n=1 Tax=Rhizobium sp. PP-CC-3G-465 TaxID=2135648 RepID=UPI00104A1C16|nr:TniQ protein [Rhizobium sp. PP-CC-3G-465]
MQLPIVPPPFPDERLSSWLERIADVYLVSLGELQAHVGWARPALELEREPVLQDIERIAVATNSSVVRLFAMTFDGFPSRYRNLLRWKGGEICPVCSQGMQRPPRLRTWSFAFSFWCERHRQPLFSRDTRGVSALADLWAARRGGEILTRWAMEKDIVAAPVELALSLLLSPVRKASPAAPWELARLPSPRQHEHLVRSKHFRRPALTIVVPEFRVAVPIYDQQLPSDITQLSAAPLAERYALAIGVARFLKDPVEMIARMLKASDEHSRTKIATLVDQWPAAIRNTIDRRSSTSGRDGLTTPKDEKARFSDPHKWPYSGFRRQG